MPFIVPGIGYAGLGQQTAAAQQVFRQAMGGARATRSTGARKRTRRRKSSKSRTSTRSRRRGGKSKAAKFVKGSTAARRHMAKLRKMRKR
jgi:hypothetical protein